MFFQGFKSYRGKAVQGKRNLTTRFLCSVMGRVSKKETDFLLSEEDLVKETAEGQVLGPSLTTNGTQMSPSV